METVVIEKLGRMALLKEAGNLFMMIL